MGVKIDLLEEIRSRIETAMQSGGVLESIKRLRVGSVEEARKENDFPVINIQLTGGDEEGDRPNRHFRDNMAIQVTLICNKLTGQNSLYSTATQTGALYLFENLLNVLDKKTDGTLNNTFNGQAEYLRRNSYSVDESTSQIIITLNISAPSKSFALGGR